MRKGASSGCATKAIQKGAASKKKIKFRNKPISNFDIMNWVKELKIKHFDGVFNKDSRQDNNNCEILNLDSNNGLGTHWYVMLILFILIPLDYHHPKIFFLSNNTILHNIKKRYLFFVVTFVFFFLLLKKSKMVIQFTTFCIKF